ncbi:ABC transporter permease [Halospeciosus flavus]|uniref:ABC transporter permease n=1 Tax=Halospeciosus flavus TaxID=3032283 RepID=A0ABD5Z458_9EURY|nr:ABC transporter permease [Halospeciosus flavus]
MSRAADPEHEDKERGPWHDRARNTLGRLVEASALERVLISFAALLTSIVVGAFVMLLAGWLATCPSGAASLWPLTLLPGWAGATMRVPVLGTFCYNPLEVYWYLFVGSFANPQSLSLSLFNLSITLKELTLLLFTGLSVAVAFRAGMFNIGAQGQLVLGALASALAVLWAAPYVPAGTVGTLVLIPLAVVVGALAGGLYAAIPGALKAYAEANEVITTIMLNFVAADLAFVLVSNYFQAEGVQTVRTATIPEYAQLNPVLFGSGAPFSLVAFVFGLLLVAGIALFLTETALGYDLRVSGIQPKAAEYGGVDAESTMVTSMALSGALAGIGGTVYVLMVLGYFQAGVPSLGFDGITVSILAGNNPLGVVPAALLFGVLKSGSITIEFALGVPRQLVGVLRGLIILFVAMPEFFRLLGKHAGLGEQAAASGGERE